MKLMRIRGLREILVRLIRPLLFNIGIKQGLVHKEKFTAELLAAFADPFTDSEGMAAFLRILRWGRPASIFNELFLLTQNHHNFHGFTLPSNMSGCTINSMCRKQS